MTIEHQTTRRKTAPTKNGPPPLAVSPLADRSGRAEDGPAPLEAPPAPRDVREIAARSIALSALNVPHREPDEDLVASVRAHGVIEALVVRPIPPAKVYEMAPGGQQTGRDVEYELVIGERRLKAVWIVDHDKVLVEVRILTDQQAADLQYEENAHREDLSPLQEAHVLAGLMRRGGDAASVAARVHKSERHVAQRLALLELPEDAQAALQGGRLLLGAAMQIAVLPAADRAAATALLVPAGVDRSALSVTEARDLVAARFHLRVVNARWSLDDAELVAAAGACSACPKRTSAQLSLLPEGVDEDDRCTDRKCWGGKDAAWVARRVASAAAEGIRVLDATKGGHAAAEAKQLVRRPWAQHVVDLDGPCEPLADALVEVAQRRVDEALENDAGDEEVAAATVALARAERDSDGLTWRKVLGDAAKPTLLVCQARETGGDRVLEFVDEREALEALKRAGHAVVVEADEAEAEEPAAAPVKKPVTAWKQEQRTRELVRAKLVPRVVAAAEKAGPRPGAGLWRALIGAAVAEHIIDTDDVVERRGWKNGAQQPAEVLQLRAGKLSEGELCGLLVEVFCCTSDGAAEVLAKHFGVDVAKLRTNAQKQAKTELEAEAKSPAPKASKSRKAKEAVS